MGDRINHNDFRAQQMAIDFLSVRQNREMLLRFGPNQFHERLEHMLRIPLSPHVVQNARAYVNRDIIHARNQVKKQQRINFDNFHDGVQHNQQQQQQIMNYQQQQQQLQYNPQMAQQQQVPFLFNNINPGQQLALQYQPMNGLIPLPPIPPAAQPQQQQAQQNIVAIPNPQLNPIYNQPGAQAPLGPQLIQQIPINQNGNGANANGANANVANANGNNNINNPLIQQVNPNNVIANQAQQQPLVLAQPQNGNNGQQALQQIFHHFNNPYNAQLGINVNGNIQPHPPGLIPLIPGNQNQGAAVPANNQLIPVFQPPQQAQIPQGLHQVAIHQVPYLQFILQVARVAICERCHMFRKSRQFTICGCVIFCRACWITSQDRARCPRCNIGNQLTRRCNL